MPDGYINIRYFREKILIDYHLSKSIGPYFKTIGIMLKEKNWKQVKQNLNEMIKQSPEKNITITSKDTKGEEYSKIEKDHLIEIRKSLKNRRPDISFKLKA